MANPIDILLVTGFLGSGKTTFLNSLLEQIPQDRKIAILMNEFGDIGIDGALVQGNDYEIVEISRGSIFCICVKTDYIKAMHRISHVLQPDLLIIETTGVANPVDMGRDLQLSIFKNRFSLLDQVCIIDPTSFEDLFGIYTSIEKQVTSSKIFIMNKTDIAMDQAVERSKVLIREHNPQARFLETTYCKVPVQEIWPEISKPLMTETVDRHGHELGSAELDDIIDEIFSDRSREFTPPDSVISEVLVWNGDDSPEFLNVLHDLPKGILRSKGFLKSKGEVKLFNLTMRQVNIDDVQDAIPEALINKLVVIYPHGTAAAVDEFLRRQPLFHRLPGSLKDNRLIQFGISPPVRA